MSALESAYFVMFCKIIKKTIDNLPIGRYNINIDCFFMVMVKIYV